MERATIKIPLELMERLAKVAAERGVDVDPVAREALEEKVGERCPRPRSLGMGASGSTGLDETVSILDMVALLEDLPDCGLYRGQVGTVVETLAPGVFEVEFSDNEGRAYASLALEAKQLMVLRREPDEVA